MLATIMLALLSQVDSAPVRGPDALGAESHQIASSLPSPTLGLSFQPLRIGRQSLATITADEWTLAILSVGQSWEDYPAGGFPTSLVRPDLLISVPFEFTRTRVLHLSVPAAPELVGWTIFAQALGISGSGSVYSHPWSLTLGW